MIEDKKVVKQSLPTPQERQYLQLSDLCNKHLIATQRSDTFVKHFKDAVTDGEITAGIQKGASFTLPKSFHKRNEEGTHQKTAREYIILNDDALQKWFEAENSALAATREGKVPVNLDSVSAGLIDFEALARETRKKLRDSKEKGRNLGLMHGKNKKVVNADLPEEEIEEEVVTPAPKKAKAAPAEAKPAAKKTKPAPVAVEEDEDEDLLDE